MLNERFEARLEPRGKARLDRLFSQIDLQLTAVSPLYPSAAWQPAVDLYRCAEGWVLKFELAGVKEEDITVRFDSRGITIVGRRLDRMPFDVREPHLIEIAYSRFERFVALPEPCENVQYRMSFQDGMLYVYVLHGSR
jgi:HSP20 family protein